MEPCPCPSSSSSFTEELPCSRPASCPLQKGNTPSCKMSFAATHRSSSLKDTPNQHQQHLPDSLVDEQSADHPECSSGQDVTSQCTDKCVVIICDDPEHNGSECVHSDAHCNLDCQGGEECRDCDGFDDFVSKFFIYTYSTSSPTVVTVLYRFSFLSFRT